MSRSTTLAATGYWTSVLLRSQRFFPPLVLLALGVVVLTANDTGPLLGAYGACAAILFAATVWITVVAVGADDPVQRAVTVVNARGAAPVLTGVVLTSVAAGSVGALLGLVFPALSGDHVFTLTGVVAGGVVQLGAVLTGVAVGLASSRLVVHRQVTSLLVALVLVLVTYLVPWATPLPALLRISARTGPVGDRLGTLCALSAVSALLLVAVAVAVHAVAVRRE